MINLLSNLIKKKIMIESNKSKSSLSKKQIRKRSKKGAKIFRKNGSAQLYQYKAYTYLSN